TTTSDASGRTTGRPPGTSSTTTARSAAAAKPPRRTHRRPGEARRAERKVDGATDPATEPVVLRRPLRARELPERRPDVEVEGHEHRRPHDPGHAVVEGAALDVLLARLAEHPEEHLPRREDLARVEQRLRLG